MARVARQVVVRTVQGFILMSGDGNVPGVVFRRGAEREKTKQGRQSGRSDERPKQAGPMPRHARALSLLFSPCGAAQGRAIASIVCPGLQGLRSRTCKRDGHAFPSQANSLQAQPCDPTTRYRT